MVKSTRPRRINFLLHLALWHILSDNGKTIVSVIIPVYNAEDFLDECFESIKNQETSFTIDLQAIDKDNVDSDVDNKVFVQHSILIEVSIFEDGSTDATPNLIKKWIEIFNSLPHFCTKFSSNCDGSPKGVGYAKNRAVEQSSGEYLCFCDADDVMKPDRIIEQYKATILYPHLNKDSIIGSKFTRFPDGSTRVFTSWANNLTQEQLDSQIFTSFGPSLLMPTWFCHRHVFERISGGFNEEKFFPEDLLFFYHHLIAGGCLHRVNSNLIMYRYHANATTFSVPEKKIWEVRLHHFTTQILCKWKEFCIWGAGKLGRRFFRSLSTDNQLKVRVFCDIDRKKIEQGFYTPHPNPLKLSIPILHFTNMFNHQRQKIPLVVCIKTEYAWDEDGPFRSFAVQNNLIEGVDYYFFN